MLVFFKYDVFKANVLTKSRSLNDLAAFVLVLR